MSKSPHAGKELNDRRVSIRTPRGRRRRRRGRRFSGGCNSENRGGARDPCGASRNAGVQGGTESSNLLCSSGESATNRAAAGGRLRSAPLAHLQAVGTDSYSNAKNCLGEDQKKASRAVRVVVNSCWSIDSFSLDASAKLEPLKSGITLATRLARRSLCSQRPDRSCRRRTYRDSRAVGRGFFSEHSADEGPRILGRPEDRRLV
jgi:hypothetical protein